MAFLIFVWLVCACLSGYIASQKGRSVVEGVFLGGVLGVIGLFVELFLPDQTQ